MGLKGTNQEFGRPYNRRIVLEAIRANGPTTRGRIADEVGLTVQTVSTIIRELEEQGFILSAKEEPRGRGGFGYDPLFFAMELGKTFGEASLAEKERVSHRGRAFHALVRAMRAG